MHVQLAPRRREAVTVSGSRRGAGRGVREVCPGHADGVVHEQIAERACARYRPIISILCEDDKGAGARRDVDALEEGGVYSSGL